MSKNIVFFGKAETGKSTLAGYLYAHKLSDKDKNKIWNNRRKELGVLYDYQERFSYLLDNYFEIKRHKEEKSGTTRTLHIENISDDFNIIDTPEIFSKIGRAHV